MACQIVEVKVVRGRRAGRSTSIGDLITSFRPLIPRRGGSLACRSPAAGTSHRSTPCSWRSARRRFAGRSPRLGEVLPRAWFCVGRVAPADCLPSQIGDHLRVALVERNLGMKWSCRPLAEGPEVPGSVSTGRSLFAFRLLWRAAPRSRRLPLPARGRPPARSHL